MSFEHEKQAIIKIFKEINLMSQWGIVWSGWGELVDDSIDIADGDLVKSPLGRIELSEDDGKVVATIYSFNFVYDNETGMFDIDENEFGKATNNEELVRAIVLLYNYYGINQVLERCGHSFTSGRPTIVSILSSNGGQNASNN